MRASEIRTAFRDYFAARDHLVVPSSSLVPSATDTSVLLTTAGMQQFMPYYLGVEQPPAPRATSIQKCFRTTDVDEVGHTARHLTFFEMMGNFSFGDYFKDGAVRYAWDLSTNGFGIDPATIWITVFEGADGIPRDDEAIELWRQAGVPDERVVALGDDNFWRAGATGPCGPCSELHVDRGPAHGCGRPLGKDASSCGPQCACDRVLEFWNLVFMVYDAGADGTLTPLPKPSVDTGAGLERTAALLQRVHSVYETDAFTPLISACEAWSGARYQNGGAETRALRVLADHGRAMVFLASDGVIPANEQRGYILRRVIRRAAAHAQRIGLAPPLLDRLARVVIDTFGDAYPELHRHRDAVIEILVGEEERFARTLANGTAILDELITAAKAEGATQISAADAFRLHDTFGFPIEVTAEIAAEHNLVIDERDFARLMDEQRRRARSAAAGGSERERAAVFVRSASPTVFVGYDEWDIETMIEQAQLLDETRMLVKLRRSPFYAEGGGQVADQGLVEAETGRGVVTDVFRFDQDQALLVVIEHGTLAAGQPVRAIVDAQRRKPTMANHTGTHLLHRALRDVLGEHAEQRGSAVRPDKLRFDFAHPRSVSDEQLVDVEDRVNERVSANLPVHTFETSQEEARRLGATMLFGEKYGQVVRVVEIVEYSRELCGGTHVRSTSEVGPFRILAESSVGQGVRRIEAVTGAAALAILRRADRTLVQVARELRTEPDRVGSVVSRLRERVSELERGARDQSGGPSIDALAAQAEQINGVAVLAAVLTDTQPDELLSVSDTLRGRLGTSVVVLGSAADGRAHVVASATSDAVKAGVSAAEVIGVVAPLIGGGGGGRPTMARAGGKDAARLTEALQAARRLLQERLAG